MEFYFKGNSIERFLLECIEAYHELLPKQASKFAKYVKQESAVLAKPSGMSKDGCMLNFCKMPPHFYPFVKQQAAKRLGIEDFWKNPKHYRLMVRLWKTAAVKRTPTPFYDLGAKSEQTKTVPTRVGGDHSKGLPNRATEVSAEPQAFSTAPPRRRGPRLRHRLN